MSNDGIRFQTGILFSSTETFVDICWKNFTKKIFVIPVEIQSLFSQHDFKKIFSVVLHPSCFSFLLQCCTTRSVHRYLFLKKEVQDLFVLSGPSHRGGGPTHMVLVHNPIFNFLTSSSFSNPNQWHHICYSSLVRRVIQIIYIVFFLI